MKFAKHISTFLLVAHVACSYAHDNDESTPLVHIYVDMVETTLLGGRDSQAVSKLKGFLDARPFIHYKLHYVSWPKALEQLERNDVLIMQLTRTPERESNFHWLLTVDTVPIALYSREQYPGNSGTLESLINKPELKIACAKSTAYCDLLLDKGFSEKQIEQVDLNDVLTLERLMLAGRVDFMVNSEYYVLHNMKNLGLSMEDIGHRLVLADLTDYLAAPKSIDSRILALFQRPPASEQGN